MREFAESQWLREMDHQADTCADYKKQITVYTSSEYGRNKPPYVYPRILGKINQHMYILAFCEKRITICISPDFGRN